MKIADILDPSALQQQIRDGYITERLHPDDPSLKIFNYTPRAQFERHWTDETSQCRGLIVRGDEVVARPFPKFFNYGEEPDRTFDLDAPVVVTDKADGSLGILYTAPDGLPAIATRGSFTSDQAVHATALYRKKYLTVFTPVPEFDYMFEIVYPENRIVLDYFGMDDLILLAPFDMMWPGPRVQTMPYNTLRDALNAPPRDNAEGVVVWFSETNERLKIKQADYLELHKIVTGLNELTVWRHMGDNQGSYESLLQSLPEEFHEWTSKVAIDLLRKHDRISSDALAAYAGIRHSLPKDYDRKAFALAAQQADHDIRSLLFLIEDRRSTFDSIWKKIRPVLKEQEYANS